MTAEQWGNTALGVVLLLSILMCAASGLIEAIRGKTAMEQCHSACYEHGMRSFRNGVCECEDK